MSTTVLVANRGEIACRIMRSARALGMRTVAVYSDADATSLHVEQADHAVHIGGPRPQESYLDGEGIIRAAVEAGADLVHPGYGFLSENAVFAQAVIDASLGWVGPSPELIEMLGNKANARSVMARHGFPVNGTTDGGVDDVGAAVCAAEAVGLPVMVKAAAGGGGIGMQVVEDPQALPAAVERLMGQAERLFGDGRVMVERYLPSARHVEIQVFGLRDGRVVALGERDCSVQRRFQKVVEETPSPGVGPELRKRMCAAAAGAAEALGYENAGTFECLVSGDEFVFLEVNTRLQVEHPVTELVNGVDLVAEQLRVATGQPPSDALVAAEASGHAIELRVYAEDPQSFLPAPGTIEVWSPPEAEHVRVDAGYRAGDEVTPYYDPLLAKLCAWGADRDAALARARDALAAFTVEGVRTNLAFLAEVLDDDAFGAGAYDTRFVTRLRDAG